MEIMYYPVFMDQSKASVGQASARGLVLCRYSCTQVSVFLYTMYLFEAIATFSVAIACNLPEL